MKRMLIILIAVMILINGCSNQTIQQASETLEQEDKVISSEDEVVAKEPFEMVLVLEDFPEGWEQLQRFETTKSDINEKGIKLGWKKGYVSELSLIKPVTYKEFGIVHAVSIYPIENVKEAINLESDENTTIEILTDPEIVEGNKAYKITTKNEGSKDFVDYAIYFYKGNVVEKLTAYGDFIDYEFLKEMTKKAEKKMVLDITERQDKPYEIRRYFLDSGDSIVVDKKTVELINVGSGGEIIVNVNGDIETISSGNKRNVGELAITNRETFYDSLDQSNSAAVVLISKGNENNINSESIQARQSSYKTFNGVGYKATERFYLNEGLIRFNLRHDGSSNFAVQLLEDKTGRYESLLVNKIGKSEGSKAIRVSRPGYYLLNIEADGAWFIEVN